MDQVAVAKDQAYRPTEDAPSRKFDLFRPSGAAPRDGWPVVVLVHGGPLPTTVSPKDWPVFESYGRLLAASGLSAITFSFQFPSENALPQAADEVAQLFDHLRRNADKYSIDSQRFCLWAFSGGGPHLSLAVRRPATNIRCMVSFYGQLETRQGQEDFSPLAQLRKARQGFPPTFIARAGKDFPDLNRSVDAFVAEAKAQEASLQVETYDAGLHGFDFQQDTDESRAMIREAVTFVKRHLISAIPSSGFLPVAGGDLFYEVRGKGHPIVFLHDGLLHRECWDEQWEAFAPQHQVVRYDRRGYGRSPAAQGSYSETEDLEGLLGHLGLNGVTLVGASAGANTALEYALEHPERVARLVLVGPVVSGLRYSEHFQRRNQAAFEPLARRGDVQGTIENWVNDAFLTAPDNQVAKVRLRELLEANAHNLTRPWQHARPPQYLAFKRLSEIKVPVLIVVGESDIPDVHAHAGAIQAGISGAARVVLPRAGHLPYLERPEEFARLAKELLGAESPPESPSADSNAR